MVTSHFVPGRREQLTIPAEFHDLGVLPDGREADEAGDQTKDDGPDDFFIHFDGVPLLLGG